MPSSPTEPPDSTPKQRRGLYLRFLTGGGQEMFLDELAVVLRHPRLVLYYFASTVLTFLLSAVLEENVKHDPGFLLLLPILGLTTFIGIFVFTGLIHFIAWLRPAADPVRVHVSFPLVLSIITVLFITVLLWNVLLGVPASPFPVMLLTVAGIYAFDELFIALSLRPHAAAMLADVRSYRGTEPPRRPDPPPPHSASNPTLVTTTARFPVTTLLHLQAQGNNVCVWTDEGPRVVPGPFTALVAQLPDVAGCLVHRSEWVATRAVTRALRDGRATVLELSTGTTVRVASTRAGVVRDWLAQFDAKPARRRGQSIGGGDTKRQSRPAPEITTSAIGATAPSAPRASVIPTKS